MAVFPGTQFIHLLRIYSFFSFNKRDYLYVKVELCVIKTILFHDNRTAAIGTNTNPNKHQEVVDMIQNQHQKDMATSNVTAPAEASKEPKPQGTRFKVVSPKDKIGPQQVHENDLRPCVGFSRRT